MVALSSQPFDNSKFVLDTKECFHPKCVKPSSAKHGYHRHLLICMESIKEDNFGEYHCDVCENERNLKHLVYYCPSWRYMAHVECALADVHPMYVVTNCNSCRLVLSGPSYRCEMCFDLLKSAGQKEFYLHKRCANLPNKIQHPSHSIHPLNLYTSHHPQIGRTISCDECRDICLGFIYLCEQCDFKLDVKCAALRTHKTAVLQEKEMARVTESQHFNHHHKLALGYCNDPIDETKCTICELPIIGPAYFCREYNCDYILHESCLRLPQKIEVPFQWNEIPFQMHQVPFHQEHVFVSCVFPHEDSKPQCYACPFALKSLMFAYNCEHCPINLHPTLLVP
ncbi:hypothetical protein E1A91_D11G285800v1 [Gossypium mustelinum]|uniref:DC1 domain-containing protein n=1 Tax=Gossypium mustelinum TaxID=34275 RepID=A0A5D2SXC5_GOSMU|nr:hypothetical protein E1A91_D11G285800v1 [Gossypium mustelinum]